MHNQNQNNEEILEKIKSLEDQLWDAISYISSDFCQHCSHVYKQVHQYREEIEKLKKLLHHEQ